MKYQDIVEIKKRMDFNLTEPETLVELVKDAVNKGEKVQIDMRRLKNLSTKLGKFFEENNLILKETDLNTKPQHERVVGIDGSFQLVGGSGGKWYAPISVARIIFENGFGTQPKVDIFWAGIQEIDEKDDPKPNIVSGILMLSGETKAILNWGTLNKPSYVFLDGPIVDPPVFSYAGKDYIRDRCQAINKCLEKSNVIGCVKRSRDKFYIEYLEGIVSDDILKAHLKEFPSDQHLMAYIFSYSRARGYQGPIFTKWIDVSEINPVYKSYKENGIYIASLFFQKNVMTQVLRLDVPFLHPLEGEEEVSKEIKQIAKAVDMWTYPGQDYPVPVYLAHEKCNIREGCAQVLFDEIMTKGYSVDPSIQTILSQLR